MSSRPPELPKLPLRDPYAVLGLERQADSEAIKRAYFQLVREYPPERDPARFQEIRAAYEAVRTPERRRSTDLFLPQPPPPQPNRRQPSYDLGVHPEDVLELALRLGVAAVISHDEFTKPHLL